jgi:hypothetical protein
VKLTSWIGKRQDGRLYLVSYHGEISEEGE